MLRKIPLQRKRRQPAQRQPVRGPRIAALFAQRRMRPSINGALKHPNHFTLRLRSRQCKRIRLVAAIRFVLTTSLQRTRAGVARRVVGIVSHKHHLLAGQLLVAAVLLPAPVCIRLIKPHLIDAALDEFHGNSPPLQVGDGLIVPLCNGQKHQLARLVCIRRTSLCSLHRPCHLLNRISQQRVNSLDKGDLLVLHQKINGLSARPLREPVPLVALDHQTVVFRQTVLPPHALDRIAPAPHIRQQIHAVGSGEFFFRKPFHPNSFQISKVFGCTFQKLLRILNLRDILFSKRRCLHAQTGTQGLSG